MNITIITISNKKVALGLLPLLLIIPFIIASTFTCTSNTCSGNDTVNFSDSGSLHSSIAENIVDKFSISDSTTGVITKILNFFDKFSVSDLFIFSIQSLITSTITLTTTITQIGSTCSSSSCYVNPNGTGIETIAEEVIFPVILIGSTVFGYMYIGIKFFGILVMVAATILLGLAFVGIIPSYFTLLAIIIVGAALTRLVAGIISGGHEE